MPIAVTTTQIRFAKSQRHSTKLPATLPGGKILSHLLGSVQLRELQRCAWVNNNQMGCAIPGIQR